MSISAMKQALKALEELNELSKGPSAICLPAEIDTAMDELRQAIAEAEKQEPWVKTYCGGKPNYTEPVHAIDMSEKHVHESDKDRHEPVAWHEPGAYGNVTTHKDWALANGWLPLYKEKNS